MDDLEMLKLILREKDSPFFSDEQLRFYAEKNNYDINKTAYECLLAKAEDDSIALPGGLSLPNNKEYWLRLAKKYRPNGSKIL
jgi:hypothetical protein